MIKDTDLPPLPQLYPVANAALTMRCMTDDALRALQREAFEAGMRKAASVQHRPTSMGVGSLQPVAGLTDADVEWVTNDNAELGVKIGNQFFFLYKGHSLVYESGTHDDGTPMQWRHVFKREFGECCHPVNYSDPTKWGTVSLSDSDEWKTLPSTTGNSGATGESK